MNTNWIVLLGFVITQWIGRPALPWMFITTPRVDSPRSGQVLQGLILVDGSTNINGFQSAEISFSHANGISGEGDWFLIQQSHEAIDGETLAVWDTTTIADGEYDLRVRVYLENGRTVETIVENLRVRNYSPVETDTPQAVIADPIQVTAIQTQSTLLPRPTPTGLPENPLQVTGRDLLQNVLSGVVAGIGIVILIVIYSKLKKVIR